MEIRQGVELNSAWSNISQTGAAAIAQNQFSVSLGTDRLEKQSLTWSSVD